jgi:hypothetical protein
MEVSFNGLSLDHGIAPKRRSYDPGSWGRIPQPGSLYRAVGGHGARRGHWRGRAETKLAVAPALTITKDWVMLGNPRPSQQGRGSKCKDGQPTAPSTLC